MASVLPAGTVKRRFQQGVWNPKSTVPDTLLKPSLTGRGQFRLQRRRRRRRRQRHRPAHRRAGEGPSNSERTTTAAAKTSSNQTGKPPKTKPSLAPTREYTADGNGIKPTTATAARGRAQRKGKTGADPVPKKSPRATRRPQG